MAKVYKYVYWSLPFFLAVGQGIFTLNSLGQLRYEEVAESIRNPFWLAGGLVYDGTSSNVGWYAPLLGFYNIFGFDLHIAKIFRLVLSFVSLLSLAAILQKYLGKQAWMPLLTIGLSPTLLFHNILQLAHGLDLQYFPIVLFLILQKTIWARVVGWALAMVAWMSYPTFILYLPILFLIHLRRISSRGVLLAEVVGSIVAFLAPLVAAFLFIKNSNLLLFDEVTGSGIFRGAGGSGLSFDSVSGNLAGLFKDLFVGGSSYHFDLFSGEFSLIFPILGLLLVVYCLWKIWESEKNMKFIVWLAVIAFLGAIILPSLTVDPSGAPGMRRYTPVLAAFYALFVIAWKYLNDGTRGPAAVFPPGIPTRGPLPGGASSRVTPRSLWLKVALGLLLVHHLIVYPINLAHLSDPSPNQYPLWFTSEATPSESVKSLVEKVKSEDLKLVCMDQGIPIYCRYAETYAAVAGSCIWNDLGCKGILGYDFVTRGFIPLSRELWSSYRFEH